MGPGYMKCWLLSKIVTIHREVSPTNVILHIDCQPLDNRVMFYSTWLQERCASDGCSISISSMCFKSDSDDDAFALLEEIHCWGYLRQKHSKETRDLKKPKSTNHIFSKICLSRKNCYLYISRTVILPNLWGFSMLFCVLILLYCWTFHL